MKSKRGKPLAASPRFFADGTASLAVGLVAAALLSSLAAAGLNTLAVALGLLFFAWALCLVFIFGASVLKGRRLSTKLALAAAATLAVVAFDRLEARNQPKPPQLPTPPLRLLLRSGPLPWTLQVADFTKLNRLPLYVAPVPRPQSGYPAFADNDDDDVMFAVSDVRFGNVSDRPLVLDIALQVEGEGNTLKLSGSGKGTGARQLNENDWIALNSGPTLHWLLSPVHLSPGAAVNGDLAFVVRSPTPQKLRERIASDDLKEGFRYSLRLRDRISGATEVLTLPIGPQDERVETQRIGRTP